MHQNATEYTYGRSVSLRKNRPKTSKAGDVAVNHAMKMPVVGLTLRSRLNMLVEPLSRLGKGGNAMRLATPHAHH